MANQSKRENTAIPEFQLLFRDNPMPMWVYDLNTLRFLAVNEAAIRLYGYTEDEFMDMTIADIRPPEDIPALTREIEDIRHDTMPKPEGIWRHTAKNGQVIHAEITAGNQVFEGREARLVLMQNVTAQVQTQNLLAFQKDILESIAKNVSTDFICGELCKGLETLNQDLQYAVVQHDHTRHQSYLLIAPSLPENFRSEIAHSFREPDSAPWTKAAQSGQREGFEDVLATGCYPQIKPLFAAFQMRSCWSMPVFSAKGDVVAVLSVYAGNLHTPTGFETNCTDIAVNLLSIMAERDLNKKQLTQFFYDTMAARRTVEEERMRSLEVLQQSEERFRKLAENSPDIIYVEQLPEREITYINRKKILGHPVAKFIASSEARDLIVYESDLPKLYASRKKMLRSNSPDHERMEIRLYNAKQQIEWVSVRIRVMSRYPDNSVMQLLVSLTVITEQKNIQRSIEKDKANLEALIENTSDGIWVVNRRFEIIIMNTSFQRACWEMFGVRVETGNDMSRYFPADMIETWQLLYKKAFTGERYRRDFSFNVHGKELYHEVSFNPIRNKNGDVQGASVFARNVTSKKIAADELVKANFELDSFVYRSSHDLRAPLRSVLGLIGLMRVESESDQREQYLNLIEKSVNRLDNFINDLTHFSRNSRASIERMPIDLQETLDECTENLRYMENASHVDLRLSIRQECVFLSDPARISIIFQNLLSNAVKYQRAGTEPSFVAVGIQVTPQEAVITVADNGMGIEAEYLPRIFDMFFRASASSYGSGLGLYITKQVAEKLAGRLEVESEMGMGTTFRITLPNPTPET